jgi:nitrite reductase/ring-hydroxylating ferredoxin subunit
VSERTELTEVESVPENGSWLFTVYDPSTDEEDEVILVRCNGGIEGWVNRCTHEAQRLDPGYGAAVRDGGIVCPKHGSMFDTCTGYCDNGEAAQTTLPSVEVTADDGVVYLVDDHFEFRHEGGIEDGDEENGGDDDDGGPSSTTHLSL